jgi:glycolate oxidase
VLLGFPTVGAGRRLRRRIIAAGIIPGGMEMMDKPAIHAAEAFVHAGYPLDVEALLIVELDGPAPRSTTLIGASWRSRAATARSMRAPRRARRSGCVLGRAQGGVPRRRPHLARLLLHGRHDPAQEAARGAARMREMSEQVRPAVANVFHAGDGNLHPLILYDANKPGELERAEAFGATSCGSASRSAACSPASTASASRSAT